MKKIPVELKELILICEKNIKGLTKKEDIQELLPIRVDGFNIEVIDRKICISRYNKILGNIWEESGCYPNLALLKIITKEYNIEPDGEKIIQLMKYKYIIDNCLIGKA